MKYNIKNYCDCCGDLKSVRQDKTQGIVCKDCDDYSSKQKSPKIIRFNSKLEFYENRKAV